jgi:tetratricopeptide (TPR) repeat protein
MPRIALLALMLLLLHAPMAAAQTPAPPARSAWELAAHHYKNGEYAKAAPLFHTAFEMDPQPVYLFNAALSELKAGQLPEAERDFNRVLGLKDVHPKIAERARESLAELEAARDREAAGRPPLEKPEGAPPPEEKPRAGEPQQAARSPPVAVSRTGSWRPAVGWGLVGTGALLVGVGVWLQVAASREAADLDSLVGKKSGGLVAGIDYQSYSRRMDSVDRDRLLGWSGIGVGLVAAGAGLWLALGEDAARATLSPSPGGAVLTLGF